MEVILKSDPESLCRLAADMITDLMQRKPDAVLGLATGSTPLKLYAELIRRHREEGLDFSRVRTFNLDEYVGLGPDHPQSYASYMRNHFFSSVNVHPDSTHIPNGFTEDIPAECAAYEQAIQDAGGIDLQILGIGTDGHIGFNEPTSSLTSRTRIKTLTARTLADNARFFEQEADQPHHVITMGIGTILESRQAVLLAFGDSKADAIAQAVEGPLTASVPASALQLHPKAHVFVDEAAGSQLERQDYYRWVYDQKPR